MRAADVWKSVVLCGIAVGCWVAPAGGQAFPKMDETWTVMVNGQTVQVGPDGSFRIPNVSAPDQFGSGGPGTPPDFVSDDVLRVIGISTAGETTRYAYSEPFQFAAGQAFNVGQMTITDTAPPFPQTIMAAIDEPVLTELGVTTSLRVTGTLIDGSEIDVSLREAGTTYRTSNPAVATIDQDGTVTAQGAGTAFLTALNEGATSVDQVIVAPGDPLTDVVGFVLLEDGTPVPGAQVVVVGQGLGSETTGNGSFSIADVATTLGSIQVSASSVGLGGTSTPVEPMPGLLTDVGIVTLEVAQSILVFGIRIDGQSQGEGIADFLVDLGYDATYSVSLPADLSPYAMIWSAQTVGPLSIEDEQALIAFVEQGRGLNLSGERPCCEAANQSVENVLVALTGQPYQVGGLGDISPPYSANATAVSGITQQPNLLEELPLCASGGMSGPFSTENIVATGVGGQIVAAALDSSDLVSQGGRVTVVMDTDWEFIACNLGPNTTVEVVENLTTFLLFQ